MITNQSHKTNFRLDIPDAGVTQGFQVSIQNVVLPSVEIEPVRLPINKMAQGDIPGSAMRFEPLTMRMLLDEDLNAYTEIFKWMTSIVDYKSGRSTAQIEGNSPNTLLLHILDNSKKKILITYKFIDPWPSNLGQVEWDYTEEGNPAITGDVTFSYKWFEIERNGVAIGPRQGPVTVTRGAQVNSSHPFPNR